MWLGFFFIGVVGIMGLLSGWDEVIRVGNLIISNFRDGINFWKFVSFLIVIFKILGWKFRIDWVWEKRLEGCEGELVVVFVVVLVFLVSDFDVVVFVLMIVLNVVFGFWRFVFFCMIIGFWSFVFFCMVMLLDWFVVFFEILILFWLFFFLRFVVLVLWDGFFLMMLSFFWDG